MVEIIPENAYQYARFKLGNKLTNALGLDFTGSAVRVERFNKDQLDVLRTAVENARKAGRSNVDYKDYPAMANGERPENFYKGERQKQSYLDLYVASATDPVFEMFTLIGGFGFKNNHDGGFSINDHYGFDKKKSVASRRNKPMDVYSEMVYDAQDVEQTYDFYVKGSVPPAGKPFEGYEYVANMVRGAYNSIADTFAKAGEIKTPDVPLEFIALAREKLNNWFSANPESSVVSFDELEMPDLPDMPDVMQYFAARQTKDGGYKIFDKFALASMDMAEQASSTVSNFVDSAKQTFGQASNQLGNLLDIDIDIPPMDRLVGNIPDISVDLSGKFPKLPTAILSDSRVNQMKNAIQERLYSGDDDSLSFGEAFAKNRKSGVEKFSWRGNEYTTQYVDEVADVNAA